MKCTESNYELVGYIECCNIKSSNISVPLAIDNKFFDSERSLLPEVDFMVPMKRGTGLLKESISVSLEGDIYSIEVTWSIGNPNINDMMNLHKLKDEPHHLILTSLGGNKMFVRSDEENYSFEMIEEGGEIKCTAKIVNASGGQRVM